MTTYAVTRKSDGAEAYRYNAAAPIEWHGYEFAAFDHVADEPTPTPETPAATKITKLAFRNRFTQAEKIAIEIAALDNPAGAMQQRQMAAALRSQLADQRDATHIDLSRVDTRAGVQALESVGLLAAGRAAAILDTPVAEQEAWNG